MKKPDLILKIAITISVLVISFSIFYYFVIYIPQKQKRLEDYLSTCLLNTGKFHSQMWNDYCRELEMTDNCNLPIEYSSTMVKWKKDATDMCFKVLEEIRS